MWKLNNTPLNNQCVQKKSKKNQKICWKIGTEKAAHQKLDAEKAVPKGKFRMTNVYI